MNKRVSERLQTVAVAHYGFRHEAEFAAGFLDDAGIPFRLQIDDPAIGMSSATLWVRDIDVTKVRDILEVEGGGSVRLTAKAESSGSKMQRRSRPVTVVRDATKSPVMMFWMGFCFWPRLRRRERGLALIAGVAANASAQLMEVSAGSMAPRVAVTLTVFFGGIAVLGRAPRFVSSVLRALSGDAP
ncbi:MAG: hypothetical protein OSA81_05310 [Longimicrobiales bacterium]|nr:hypothetical protein [Longimicrobiales bacterium]